MPHPHLVYMGAEYGDKRCDACEYWPRMNRCNNEIIIAKAKAGKDGLKPEMVTPEGLVKVDANGCSDEFWPRKDDFSSDSEEKE